MRSLESVDRCATRPSGARPIVFLAIDDEAARAIFAYALSASGFDVVTDERVLFHQDGASTDRPDIIVADVSPGSRCGWTFVQQLKRDRRTADIAVIAMAPDASAGTCEHARRERCVAVCRSSCTPDMLGSGIRAVLDRVR